jgi:hypothetical protein
VGVAVGLGVKVSVGGDWVVVGVVVGDGVLVGVAGGSGVWVEAAGNGVLVGADGTTTDGPAALGSIRPWPAPALHAAIKKAARVRITPAATLRAMGKYRFIKGRMIAPIQADVQ